jgi:hypothetical protein
MSKDNDKDGSKLWNAIKDITKGALLGYLSAAPKGEDPELVKKFKDTTLGKAFVVASGKLGTRVGVIVATSIALAAIAGPAAAVPLAFGLGAVAVGVVADTMDVRNTRLLKKENDNLVKLIDSKLKEKEIFVKNTELEQILSDKLIKPEKRNFKDKTLNDNFSKATDITGRISDNFGHFGDAAAALVKLDLGGFANSLAAGITKLVTGESRSDAKNDVRKRLESQIGLLREHDIVPGYGSSFELRGAVREQRIQQLALERLSTELAAVKEAGGILTHEQVRNRFEAHKMDIEKTEQAVAKTGVGHAVKSFFNDMRRAHDPHSQYYSQSSVKFEAIVQKIDVATGKKSHEVQEFKGKEFKKHQKAVQVEEKQQAQMQEQFKAAGKDVTFHSDDRKPTIVKLPSDKGTNIPDKHLAEAAKKIAKIKKHSSDTKHHGQTKTNQKIVKQNQQGQSKGAATS